MSHIGEVYRFDFAGDYWSIIRITEEDERVCTYETLKGFDTGEAIAKSLLNPLSRTLTLVYPCPNCQEYMAKAENDYLCTSCRPTLFE